MMKFDNIVLYLIGYPGTGKYSIAKEIANLHPEFRLVDSHLINNPIFTLINADGINPIDIRAWTEIGKIWDIVMNSMINLSPSNFSFILTNYLNTSEQDKFWYEEVKLMSQKRGAIFCPVLLKINIEEHKKRITNDSRKIRLKEVNIEAPERYAELNNLFEPKDTNFLNLEVSHLTAKEAAEMILDHIKAIIQRL